MSCFMSTVVNLAIVAVLIASRGKRKIRHEESIEGEIGKSHSRALSLAGLIWRRGGGGRWQRKVTDFLTNGNNNDGASWDFI